MPTDATSRFLTCRGQSIHFLEAGQPSREAVVIWHGVTGTAFDHLPLAQKLAHRHYVICPDAPGCGLSQWANDKINGYGVSFYAAIAQDILQQLEIHSVRWIGHSKGGGVGIKVAAAAAAKTYDVTHLVLNDYLPHVPEGFRATMATALAQPAQYKTMAAFVAALGSLLQRSDIAVSQPELMALARNWSRRTDEGLITFHYDPNLANQFLYHPTDFDLWADYLQIKAKVMLIHAQNSPLTPSAEVAKMQNTGNGCTVYSRSGGHLTLMNQSREQDAICQFLLS